MYLLSIKTTRLKLVNIDLKFAEDIYKHFTEDVTKFMYPSPSESITEVKNMVSDWIKENEEGRNFQLVITSNDGEFIGLVGLHNIDREIPEFGIWTKKSSWGDGYGKEAIHGIYYAIQNELKYSELNYPVDIKNFASRKIPESLGVIFGAEYDIIMLGSPIV